jgi:hypothetical protein
MRAKWKMEPFNYGFSGGYDVITFHLTKVKDTNNDIADVAVQPYKPEDAKGLGVRAPRGDWVLAVGFFGGTDLFTTDTKYDLQALRGVTSDKFGQYVLVGVNGPGCYRLRIPDWQTGDPHAVDTVDVELRIRH